MKTSRSKSVQRAPALGPRNEPELTIIAKAGLALLIAALSAFFTFLLSHSAQPSIPQYAAGDIAQANVVASVDVSIEDEESREARRAAARGNVLPVYRYDPSFGETFLAGLPQVFARCRSTLAQEASALESARKAGLVKAQPNSRWKSASRGRLENARKKASRPKPRSTPANPVPQKVSFKGLSTSGKSRIIGEVERLSPVLANERLAEVLVEEQCSVELERNLSEVFRKVFALYTVKDDQEIFPARQRAQIIQGGSLRETAVAVEKLVTLASARERLSQWLDARLRLREPFVEAFTRVLQPNLRIDLSLLESRRAHAVEGVDAVFIRIKKGKVVVRQGDEIGPEQLRQLEALRQPERRLVSLHRDLSHWLLVGVILAMLVYFLERIVQAQWSFWKRIWLASLALVISVLLLKGCWFLFEALTRNFAAAPFNDKTYFFYALPFAYGAMLITLLAGERIALTFSIFFSLLAGMVLEADFHRFLYLLMSNWLGIMAVHRATQRMGIVLAGFYLGLTQTVLFLILQMVRAVPFDTLTWAFGAGLALVSGPLSSSLLVFLLPLFERFFQVTTDLRLLELSNLNLPLVRDLIVKAPGSYNHSVNVGTLAGEAAKAIGLNSVFVRVAALYHDVGKTLQPEAFIENQQGSNLHDDVTAQESAEILREHVSGGVRLAEAAKLPQNVVDVIQQHHGTKLMQFFYVKAQRAAADLPLEEADFRYPGPKPQSKEAGVVMLADCVEAAARNLKDHSPEKLLDLIQKMLSLTVEDGQLVECDLTLGELDRITLSFLDTLSSIYHSRIAYPSDRKADHSEGPKRRTRDARVQPVLHR